MSLEQQRLVIYAHFQCISPRTVILISYISKGVACNAVHPRFHHHRSWPFLKDAAPWHNGGRHGVVRGLLTAFGMAITSAPIKRRMNLKHTHKYKRAGRERWGLLRTHANTHTRVSPETDTWTMRQRERWRHISRQVLNV